MKALFLLLFAGFACFTACGGVMALGELEDLQSADSQLKMRRPVDAGTDAP